MKKPSSHRPLLLVLSAAVAMGFVAQPAHAQYVNPAQQDAVIQQEAATGVISPGQAANLINRENGLAARESRLLRNDGGVLTPRDAAKIAREQAQNNAALNSDLMNNTRPPGTGFFSSLFGPRPAYPAGVVPTTYPVMNGAPYPYATPYTMAPPVVTTPVVTPVYAAPAYYPHHRRWEHDHWAYY